MNSDKFVLKSRIRSFRFAVNGIISLFKHEHNSRIHLLATAATIALGILLKLNFYEWALLILVIGIVFIAELLNSSIESLADRIDNEQNELIMRAKDYGAAAVLISALMSIVVGCLIFIPKLLALI
jgi:diacylglycerol kinase (ATP)